jgi:hypothetical protein
MPAAWRALRSLVSGEGLASAAAGGGEPAPLLTLYAFWPFHRSIEFAPRHYVTR